MWRAVGELVGRGEVVTAVTVWWEVGAHVAPGAPSRIGAEQFAALDTGPPGTAGAGGRTDELVAVVARAALIRTARRAADTITTAAGDRWLAPGQVVDAAQRAGQDVLRHAERLTGVPGVPQPSRTSSLSSRLAGEREIVPSTTRPAVPGEPSRAR